ncbi:NAD(P)-binding protein [Trichoderma citrinoviride]|uniref:NAD(P)-binding protein n=1 Tax=Trichoderma citrinoviride TaxID=58853 RepID=A0A2T4B187_9HYPO|nr:NAD(P)-binding protein [Trichoderma citrinoviride]PTB63074.1 NAD(P)-binding protein [Trichoderma citrinoviride]
MASKSQWLYRQLLGKTPPLAPDVNLSGKVAIVTGSNSGLGLETARQLLRLGLSKLILAVRSESKGDAARKELQADTGAAPEEIEVWNLDLSSYESITNIAHRAKALDRLDIAILNAGLFQAKETFNPVTGYEQCVQINYLSSMLLMTLLLGALKSKPGASPGRLVLVSSDTAGWVSFKEQESRPILPIFKKKTEKWDMQERYGVSKLLGQFYLTELAKRLPASVVTIDAVNPGFCYGTALTRDGDGTLTGTLVNGFRRVIGKPSSVGALSIVHAAVSFGEEAHGQYTEDGEIRPMAPIIYRPEAKEIAKQLWDETMTELSFAHLEDVIEEVVRSD